MAKTAKAAQRLRRLDQLDGSRSVRENGGNRTPAATSLIVGRAVTDDTTRSAGSAADYRYYGYETMSTGVVFGGVGAPKSLTTWSIVPWFVIDRSRMSCSFTPGLTGTSKACVAWIVGSTLKKQ